MAESRVRYRLANGPRRAQSKAVVLSILRRMAYVSCLGYACILKSAWLLAMNQGGTADFTFVLDRKILLGAFFVFF